MGWQNTETEENSIASVRSDAHRTTLLENSERDGSGRRARNDGAKLKETYDGSSSDGTDDSDCLKQRCRKRPCKVRYRRLSRQVTKRTRCTIRIGLTVMEESTEQCEDQDRDQRDASDTDLDSRH